MFFLFTDIPSKPPTPQACLSSLYYFIVILQPTLSSILHLVSLPPDDLQILRISTLDKSDSLASTTDVFSSPHRVVVEFH